jgi:hypothetical protein
MKALLLKTLLMYKWSDNKTMNNQHLAEGVLVNRVSK